MADPATSTADRLADALLAAGPQFARLADALLAAGPQFARLAVRARAGEFDDYRSPHALPQVALVSELHKIGAPGSTALVERVVDGEFDGTEAEAADWAASPGGSAAGDFFDGLVDAPAPVVQHASPILWGGPRAGESVPPSALDHPAPILYEPAPAEDELTAVDGPLTASRPELDVYDAVKVGYAADDGTRHAWLCYVYDAAATDNLVAGMRGILALAGGRRRG